MYVGLYFENSKVTFTSACIYGPLKHQTAKEITEFSSYNQYRGGFI